MANTAHSTLTGSNLHEPKGAATAAAGSVYIANGSGSGSWTISEAVVTGMIADFATPLAPTGWLECDGSDVSTATYSALYTAMTIQQTGSRGVGSGIITGLTSTANMKAGYYVFGTGIGSGTTISSVDSATQISLSGAAGSSGSSTVIVSPWLLNTGTIRVPNCTTSGRFRRSRTSSTIIGATQADQNQAHTHTGTTAENNLDHTHTGLTNLGGVDHTHDYLRRNNLSNFAGGGASNAWQNDVTSTTSGASAYLHDHSFTTGGVSTNHTHTLTTASSGGTEARPLAIVVITCVKT